MNTTATSARSSQQDAEATSSPAALATLMKRMGLERLAKPNEAAQVNDRRNAVAAVICGRQR